MSVIKGWERKTFNELGTCIRGVSYKPDDLQPAPAKENVTLLRSNNIRDGRLNYDNLQFVNQSVVREHQKLQNEDIAICMSNGNRALVGKSGQFVERGDNAVYTVGVFCSIFRPANGFDAGYIRHLFGSDKYQKQLDGILAGSAINNLKGSDIDGLIAFCPNSKPEQTKIAEILSKVDRAIEQTEELIAKQKRIKTGLMQDLLTRGIDEHGNLRSYQTHKFKDSKTPLERIPLEWEVKVLGDCYAEPARNGLYKPKEFYGAGNSMVHMPQMFRGLIVDLTSAVRVQVDRSEIDRFGLQTNDLLIARRSLVLEGAGRCALVPEVTEPTTFESSIIRVRLRQDQLNPTYVNFFLNSDAGYRMRLPFIRQVAVSGVAGEDVGQFYIPVPDADEQRRIVDCFSKSEVLISGMIATANKLKRQKTALMQDLLTGKKRITPLLTQPQEASA